MGIQRRNQIFLILMRLRNNHGDLTDLIDDKTLFKVYSNLLGFYFVLFLFCLLPPSMSIFGPQPMHETWTTHFMLSLKIRRIHATSRLLGPSLCLETTGITQLNLSLASKLLPFVRQSGS